MKIVILGGGVIGLTTAYFLAKENHQVTIIEKDESLGNGASFANGGQLSYSHCYPFTNKEIIASLVKRFTKNDRSVGFNPSYTAKNLKWIKSLISNLSSANLKKNNAESLLKLALYSKEQLANIISDTKIDFDYSANGTLYLYRNQESFEKGLEQAKEKQQLGYNFTVMNSNEIMQQHPDLLYATALYKGIFFTDDASGDSYKFCKGLQKSLEENPQIEILCNHEITNLDISSGKINKVITSQGEIEGDEFVIALGSYTENLQKILPIPIKPIKGYSLTVKTDHEVNCALIDAERKIVYSPLNDRIRVAGLFDFNGFCNKSPEKKIKFIKDSVKNFLPNLNFSYTDPWVGFRPFTSDCLPIIGRSSTISNLSYNLGHNMLGWTLAAASSKLASDIIYEQPTNFDISPFSAERFGI